MDQLMHNHKDQEFITQMAIYLAKMASQHEYFCSKSTNLVGASAIYVALKICEQMRQS
jgi:hypothetical protein